MPVTIESVDVNCAPEEAFAFVSSPENSVKTSPTIKEIREFHGGQAQVGDQWLVVNDFMGREIISNVKLLESDPPTKLVYDNNSDSADIHVQWTFEAIDGGTRVTFHSEGEPKGFFASLALNIVKGKFDESVRTSLQNIKSALEA